jgi:hypothetical protein
MRALKVAGRSRREDQRQQLNKKQTGDRKKDRRVANTPGVRALGENRTADIRADRIYKVSATEENMFVSAKRQKIYQSRVRGSVEQIRKHSASD